MTLPKGPKKVAIGFFAFLFNIITAPLWFLLAIFKPKVPKIYFCYNQSIHQVYHSLFVAIELSHLAVDRYEVVVLSTSREASRIIEDELASIPNNVIFKKIYHTGYDRVDFNVDWFVLLCRLRIWNALAIVVSDYYDNVFRKLWFKTFWVFIPHGIANRRFSFDAHVHDYDMVILSGERDRRSFEKHIGVLKNAAVLGYPKLDYLHYHKLKPRLLFKDQRPVVLYNPHFEKDLSSFFDKGIELLKAIARSKRFNVIFMPHPDLARKYSGLLDQARLIPGIAVISRPKINLEYMAMSDIYITDISSSVFEWFYFDKPVIFFNTKKVDWKNNSLYPVWEAGAVAEDVSGMLVALDNALSNPMDFQDQRRELLKGAFLNSERIVSKDIAAAISARLSS